MMAALLRLVASVAGNGVSQRPLRRGALRYLSGRTDETTVLLERNQDARRTDSQRMTPSMFFVLLPVVCVTALPHTAMAQQSCVDVEVEGERHPAFDCLNDQLKAAAQAAAPTNPDTAIADAVGHGEPNKVGTFSYTGQSIRMGSNFGKSANPQRPVPPAYYNPPLSAPPAVRPQ